MKGTKFIITVPNLKSFCVRISHYTHADVIDTAKNIIATNQPCWTSFVVGLLFLSGTSSPTCIANTGAASHALVVVAHATLRALTRAWRPEAQRDGTEWGVIWTLLVRMTRSRGDDLRFLARPVWKINCIKNACL